MTTPRRSIRIPDAEWHAAAAVAGRRGDNLSELIRAALRRYVARNTVRNYVYDDTEES